MAKKGYGADSIQVLEGLQAVARQAQMPFLAYLIRVVLEEANNEKSERR